ncbi:MAG: hypothetical protein JNL36_01655 [Candidatus Kapabacteria bacterium]|nr:hypothetical protein [Candidatus Kapabacteria bacterium]
MKTIVVIFSFICTISAFAQNENGERPKGYTDYYYNYISFHRAFPILRTIPPIDTTMPLDIQLTYFYVDSLFRRPINQLFGKHFDKLIKDLHWNSDTIRYAWKFLYKLEDYDPIKSAQYKLETFINGGVKYKSKYFHTKFNLVQKTKTLPDSLRLKVYSLIEPIYVLKIVVFALDSIDSTREFNVICKVLDTLKGKKIPMLPENNTLKSGETIKSSFPLFQFSYLSSTVQQNTELSHGKHLYKYYEPHFYDASKFMMRMKPGDTAVVFLFEGNDVRSKTHDYLYIRIDPFASNGALPIINGKVKDINKIWSNELYLPYEEWKEEFEKNKRFVLDFEL